MNSETFNKLLDELDGNSLETLKQKNAKYASPDDCLHNFDSGAEIMGRTPAQCAWGYMTKHLTALRDKVEKNDFSDRDDLLEKCQDIINYIRFIWLIGNEENGNKVVDDLGNEHAIIKTCDTCAFNDTPASVDPCGNCDRGNMWEENDHIFHAETCKYYSNGKCTGTREIDPCNYKPLSGCRYYDMYGYRLAN